MKYMTLIAQALFLLFFGFKITKKKKKRIQGKIFHWDENSASASCLTDISSLIIYKFLSYSSSLYPCVTVVIEAEK